MFVFYDVKKPVHTIFPYNSYHYIIITTAYLVFRYTSKEFPVYYY